MSTISAHKRIFARRRTTLNLERTAPVPVLLLTLVSACSAGKASTRSRNDGSGAGAADLDGGDGSNPQDVRRFLAPKDYPGGLNLIHISPPREIVVK